MWGACKLKTIMAELDHNGLNPICENNTDIRNWSDTKIVDEMLKSTLTTTILVKAFIPVVFIIGGFGNVAFILLVVRVRMMRTTINFYLAHLAAADLMLLSVETLDHSWRYVSFKYVNSESFHTSIGCVMYYFFIHVAGLSSIILITLVSYDRYFSICHPIKYRITENKKQASYILTFLTWIISAILSLFRTLASTRLEYECILWPPREKYKYFPGIVRHCTPIHPYFQKEVLEHIVHSVPFITALVMNSIINVRIVQRLRRPPPGENGNQQNEQIKRRITWMLLANSVIFFCSLAPFHLFLLFERLLNLSDSQQMYYWDITFVFAMLNSAINPILYGVASPSYRRGYLKAFGIGRNYQETERTQSIQLSNVSLKCNE